MKLQQLRFVREVARNGLNISAAAHSLNTAQPGVSSQIRQLEEELGIDIFVRHGKRLTAITEPGHQVVAIIERVLQDTDSIKCVAQEFSQQATGSLSIATTHTQARYSLPPAIKRFTEQYPNVSLNIHQGNPTQICEYVLSGEADIAIATEAIATYDELATMSCYDWNRCVIVPPDHPLLAIEQLSLGHLAQYPIITYDYAFAGRSKINKAFADCGLNPDIVLTAIDSDVIKTYVELGLGVGILASVAFSAQRDTTLRSIDASHLFDSSTVRIGIRRGCYLRSYIYDFIQFFAPHLTHGVVDKVMAG